MRRSRLGVQAGGIDRCIWSKSSRGHLAARIASAQAAGGPGLGWRLLVTHRELAREGLEAAYLTERLAPRAVIAPEFGGAAATAAPVQAQEA